jgi:outer membrane protein
MSDPHPGLVLLLALSLSALPAAAAAPPSPPLDLRRAMELAVERAPELAVARATVQEEAAASRAAADAFRPEAYLSSNPGYGRGLPPQLPAIASIGMRKTLYDPQRRLGQIAARVDEDGARSGASRTRREVARTAAQLYARSWADEHLLASAGRQVEALSRMRESAEALHGEGRITDLELAQSRLREARVRLKRADLESARDLDRAELRRLTGWPEDAPLALAEDPLAGLPEPAGDDLAAARAADPDLRLQEKTLELLGESSELRRRPLSPTLEAVAQYSRLTTYNDTEQYYRKFKADDWSAAISITLPLWTGGKAADENAQAEAHRTAVEEQRRAREAELASQVRRAAADEARARAALDLARQAVQVAGEALKVAHALAAEGRIAPEEAAARQADLADAEEESLRATAGLAEARTARLALRGDLSPPPPAAP